MFSGSSSRRVMVKICKSKELWPQTYWIFIFSTTFDMNLANYINQVRWINTIVIFNNEPALLQTLADRCRWLLPVEWHGRKRGYYRLALCWPVLCSIPSRWTDASPQGWWKRQQWPTSSSDLPHPKPLEHPKQTIRLKFKFNRIFIVNLPVEFHATSSSGKIVPLNLAEGYGWTGKTLSRT